MELDAHLVVCCIIIEGTDRIHLQELVVKLDHRANSNSLFLVLVPSFSYSPLHFTYAHFHQSTIPDM
jgi:hypothetical protein